MRPLGLAAIVVVAGMASADHVLAECNPEGTYPKFADAAASARTIVLGDVVDLSEGGPSDPVVDGWSSSFTLLVGAIVRGSAPLLWEFSAITTVPCAPPVVVHTGDRIVLALEARNADTGVTFNTVAWVVGQAPPQVPFERLTEADVLSFGEGVGLRPGDPAATDSGPPLAAGIAILVGVLLAAGAGALMISRARRSGSAK